MASDDIWQVTWSAVAGLFKQLLSPPPARWCLGDLCSVLGWLIVGLTILSLVTSIIAVWLVLKTFEETRRIGRAQTRAYLSAHEVFMIEENGCCLFQVKNFGQTPARRLVVRTRYDGKPDPWINHDFGHLNPGHFWQGSVEASSFWKRSPETLPAQIIVWIQYRDVYNRPHSLTQSFRLDRGKPWIHGKAGMGLVPNSTCDGSETTE